MSAITVGGDLVHYEVLGRGRPVILVHGWLGSWRYWVPTLQQLQNNYRVYALDLYGFGDTAKNPAKYSLEHQIALLDDFMTELGLPKAALIGHGLGALVVIEFARRYPDRAARVLAISPPLFDTGDLATRRPAARRIFNNQRNSLPAPNTRTPSSLPSIDSLPDVPPEMTGPNAPTILSASAAMRAALLEAARARGVQNLPATPTPPPPSTPTKISTQEFMLSRPTDTVEMPTFNPMRDVFGSLSPDMLLGRCFKRTEPTYEKLAVDVAKLDPRAINDSVAAYDAGWALDTFRLLPMPTVVVHGTDDPIVPPPNEDVLNYITFDKEQMMLPIQLPGVRHFPMLEDERFFRITNEFLELADINRISLKERWRRRTR